MGVALKAATSTCAADFQHGFHNTSTNILLICPNSEGVFSCGGNHTCFFVTFMFWITCNPSVFVCFERDRMSGRPAFKSSREGPSAGCNGLESQED